MERNKTRGVIYNPLNKPIISMLISVHLKLKEYLLDREYDHDDFPRILDLLQQSYDCLGIKCTDVGTYIDKDTDEIAIAECTDIDTNHPLASFIPKEDVRTLSKVDLDIHAINQLLQFPTTTNHRMAQLYYQYGHIILSICTCISTG